MSFVKKKLRTTFWQNTSERLHLNLSQPTVLKYLLTTLQSNKASKSDFICFLMSNFRGVFRTLSNGSRKIPPGKIPTHQTPPWKILPGKSFLTISSINTSSIAGWKNVHVHSPRMKNYDMSRTAQCSYLTKNSNNQRKLTMSSDRVPSWNLSFVNIEYC